MNREAFEVGDWVKVAAFHRFDRRHVPGSRCENRAATRVVFAPPRVGRIVGATRKQLGLVVWGGGDEPTHFEQRSGMWVWLVRLGVTNRPICVAPGDLARLDGYAAARLPWRSGIIAGG